MWQLAKLSFTPQTRNRCSCGCCCACPMSSASPSSPASSTTTTHLAVFSAEPKFMRLSSLPLPTALEAMSFGRPIDCQLKKNCSIGPAASKSCWIFTPPASSFPISFAVAPPPSHFSHISNASFATLFGVMWFCGLLVCLFQAIR